MIYIDDIVGFSKRREDHIDHIKEVLKKYREFGISLNPKKFIFGVMKGKLLGHIMSKEGIKIDLERI